MSVSIRRMQRADVDIVLKFEKEIFSDPWTLGSFLTEIENKQNSYSCVLLKDNLVAGYAVVWYYSGEVHIGNFAVHPDFRKQGLGKKLLTNILDKFYEVRKSNMAAISLYKKFAFEELYVRENYYSNNEDAIVMWKKLKR